MGTLLSMDTFDVNSPEAQLMRLHDALEDVGERLQLILDKLLDMEDPVSTEDATLVCDLARCTGSVQGMASILDTLGYAADR